MGMRMATIARLQTMIEHAHDKLLARAFRWKRMLDSGDFATMTEPAEREGIAQS